MTLVDQVTGDVYDYYYEKKIFISVVNVDHENAQDLQNFLNDKFKDGSKQHLLIGLIEYLPSSLSCMNSK